MCEVAMKVVLREDFVFLFCSIATSITEMKLAGITNMTLIMQLQLIARFLITTLTST